MLFIENNNSVFHVTCVMHNSRVSQRMIDYHVKKGVAEFLSLEEESMLIQILVDHIQHYQLDILALNLCADHLHFVICCKSELLNSIAGRLKSQTARAYNIWRGLTTPEKRGHAPLSTLTGLGSLSTVRGTPQHSLWAQKFNRVLIESYEQLRNTLHYIEYNRQKHGLKSFPEDILLLIKTALTFPDSSVINKTLDA